MRNAKVNPLAVWRQAVIGFGLASVIAAAATAADVPTRTETVLGNVTATIQAIDLKTRELTIKNEDGELITLVAGPEIKRLNEFQAGDVIVVGYSVSLAAELREPTAAEKEKPLSFSEEILGASGTTAPAGLGTRQIKAVTTIEALSRLTKTVTIKGPRGSIVVARVADPARLEQVRIGQTIVITYTAAVAVSVEKAGAKP